MRKAVLIFGSILVFLFSCKKNNIENKKNNVKIKSDSKDVLSCQIAMIQNKKIKLLKTVLGDSLKTTNHVVFLYNGFDCGTCIDIGYEMTKKMDSISKAQLVYVVSTSANIGRDQLKNDYQKYVYNDEKDLIRKDLKYIYTPVFLLLDSKNKICKVFYPNYNRDRKKENLFIKECQGNFK